MEQREFVVEQETAGQRIDRFLSGEDTGLSRSALQALVADGHVLCNGRLVAKSLKLKAGDTIVLEIPDAKPIEAVPQDIPLEIVYEDEHLLVVNKPKGMVVHPAPGNPDGTLVNALLWHCKGSLSGIGGEIRPGIVHRIDKDTSGLLVVAKDDATHIGLSQQMAVHSVERAYRTIVYGGFAQDEGFVESNLGRSKTDRKKMAVYPASEPHTKYAYTGYQVLERLNNFTMLECRLRPAAPIRSACTWHPSSTRWRATRCMARTIASPACTVSACTPKRLALCTRSPANICDSIRNCRNTSLVFLQRSGGERYEPSFFNACTV